LDDVFTIVIKKLQELGAFRFLFPFMLTTAIFYGLLRKSGIFTIKKMIRVENMKELQPFESGTSVNAIIALVAGFLVWAYPIIRGINIEEQLSMFFMQGLIVTLVFIVILVLTSLFMPPDLPKQLQEQFLKGNNAAWIVIVAAVIGVIILATSGLLDLIVGPIIIRLNINDIMSNDLVLTIVVIVVLLVVPLVFIFKGDKEPNGGVATSSGGGQSNQGTQGRVASG